MGGSLKVSKNSPYKFLNPVGYYGRQAIFGTKTKDKKRNDGGGTPSDPTLDFLKEMQLQQDKQAKAAELAQKQALIQSQITAGGQLEQQSEQAAQQDLATANSMQSIRDANALLAAQQAQAVAGQQATGGGFDFNQYQQEALSNLGAAGGLIPMTAANAPATSVNPALANLVNQGAGTSAKKANIFSLPSSSDLKFGGV
jgi:hypothetical protein